MNDIPSFDKIALLRLAFIGLADDELEQLASLTEICKYPAEHVLCHEGSYEEVFYIIADGNAIVSKKVGEHDEDHILRIAGRGDLIGEMGLIQNAPRSATVRTTSNCTVLEMNKNDFETMLSRSPRMAINIIRTTLDRMRENDQFAIKDLQNTNKILHQLDRNKLEFIQVAAHELRTPLTVVKGYVHLLSTFPELKGNTDLGDVLAGIINGTERMHEVVNTMLDVTRIDNDTLRVHAVPIPLKGLLKDVSADILKSATERKLDLNLEIDEETPNINGDTALIQKALQHLIVNAIKYTPDGGKIVLRSHPVIMENNLPGVEISIQDSGIGLNAEHHELVFEKFYQVGDVTIHSSGKTSFKGGGPGLGLAIVRGVARAHGGRAWVESAGNDETNYPGSTFYFLLPIDPPIPQNQIPAQQK